MCVRWRIRSVGGIIGGVIFAINVIIIGSIVISYCFTMPVCYLKSIRVAACHPDDHIFHPRGHWERCPFIEFNMVAGLEIDEVVSALIIPSRLLS